MHRFASASRPLLLTLTCLLLPASALATDLLLEDLNSLVRIRDAATSASSQDGMKDWRVNYDNAANFDNEAHDRLFRQSFFYRIGATDEQRIERPDTFVSSSVQDLNANPGNDTAQLSYQIDQGPAERFLASLDVQLVGAAVGTNTSDVYETLTLTNNGTSAILDLALFQMVDFDLGGFSGPGNDMARILSATNVEQWDNLDRTFETILGPTPDRYALGNAASLRNVPLDGSDGPTQLSNTPGFGVTIQGDVGFAFQWTVDRLDVGESFQIALVKSNRAVPEAGLASLLAMAGLTHGWLRRRGSRNASR